MNNTVFNDEVGGTNDLLNGMNQMLRERKNKKKILEESQESSL
jgi:hypothetical protein